MLQAVSFGHNAELIPVLMFDMRFQRIAVTQRTCFDSCGPNIPLGIVGDLTLHRRETHLLPWESQDGAATLLIILPRVSISRVDISLIAPQSKRNVRQFLAAVIKTAISLTGQPIFSDQLKVCRPATFPDNTRIPLQFLVWRNFTDDGPIFYPPKRRVASPSG